MSPDSNRPASFSHCGDLQAERQQPGCDLVNMCASLHRDALTHTKETMTNRYLRKGRSKSIARVAEVRQLERTKRPSGTA